MKNPTLREPITIAARSEPLGRLFGEAAVSRYNDCTETAFFSRGLFTRDSLFSAAGYKSTVKKVTARPAAEKSS